LFLLFATSVVDTDGKLLPISTTLAKLVAKFAAGVIEIGGKFSTGGRWCTLKKIGNGPNGILWGWGETDS
jgi:hypothetical protein